MLFRSTMHSAKGLEFKVVFLVGMEDGLFPSKRSIEEDESVEEERRLCYVGITRAKNKLYITNASKRTMYGSTTYTIPSRFIAEIPEKLFDDEAIENISLRKRKSEKFIDREYSQVETVISRNTGVSSKAKFGLSVDNFLKNISGVSSNNLNIAKNNNDKKVIYFAGMTVKHKKFGVGIIQKDRKSVV